MFGKIISSMKKFRIYKETINIEKLYIEKKI